MISKKLTRELEKAGLRTPYWFAGDISIRELWSFLESQNYTIHKYGSYVKITDRNEKDGFFVGRGEEYHVTYCKSLDDAQMIDSDTIGWVATRNT